MKKCFKLSLIITLALIFILGVGWGTIKNSVIGASNSLKISKSKDFTESDAISKVIKEHPDFPASVSNIITRNISIGGPNGKTANVKFMTKSQKIGESSYKITIIKDWGININGKHVESFWIYNVTPNGISLIDSENNDNLVNIMK